VGAITAADIAAVALFADLDSQSLQVLADWLEVEHVDPGRRLTHQGAAGYAFFVLRHGSADVDIDGALIRTLGPGDYFGEIAILGSGRQTATVTATSTSEVWTMFGTRFRELQQQHPRIASVIERTASARLGKADPASN
jgi:ATP-binding cassette subfamily B protein